MSNLNDSKPSASTSKPKVVLAFSGGLDTSFCILYLKNQGYDVISVTVDTGGFSEEELGKLNSRSQELGAIQHHTLDGKTKVYEDHIAYLVKGNVLRGNVYPLCVGAERVVQARMIAEICDELGAEYVAHGSTGAGNDQIRFDVAIRSLCPHLTIIAPVRDEGWTRESSAQYLSDHGFPVKVEIKDYSINEGLWGVTIGGKETHDSWEVPPDHAYPWTKPISELGSDAWTCTLQFKNGEVTGINDQEMSGVEVVEYLNKKGAEYGVGRGIHVGDTIIGIKGRIAFEAPSAAILVKAHRELEKLVLTRWQGIIKEQLSQFYGMLLHEAHYFDPAMRDIEALIDSAQSRVEGEVKVSLQLGHVFINGVRSPYSMMNTKVGTYGEQNRMWSAEDAKGFCNLYGTQSILSTLALQAAQEEK